MLDSSNYVIEVEVDEAAEPADSGTAAEKAVVGFIVFAATLCVALIAAYVIVLDGRGF